MVIAFQVILLIIMFLAMVSVISRDFSKDNKLLAISMGIPSMFCYLATLMWL